MFRRLGVLIGNDNPDVESNRTGWERAKAIREAIFTIIESGVIIGALKAGLLKTQSDQIAVLYVLAYGALGVYVLSGANFLTALVFAHYNWSEKIIWGRRVFRFITFAIAMAVPYFLQAITSDIIMQFLK